MESPFPITTLQSRNRTNNVTILSDLPHSLHTLTQARSFRNECVNVVFSQLDFLPWDNPDNLVSAEVETAARLIKNNMLVLLFLIGGPANVINMAVFYKQGLRDRVNLCLFALALADELCVLNAVIHHGEQIHVQFTSGNRFGPISTYLSNMNMVALLGFHYVSYVLSAIIATERSVLPGGIQISYWVYLRHGDRETVITSVEGAFFKAHKDIIDPMESFIFGVCLPGSVMIVVTTATMITIVKLRQTLQWRCESSSTVSAREVALTKTLVANSIFFIICLSPITVNRFSWLFFPEINSGRRKHNAFLTGLWIGTLFTYVNGTFNIFVYYFMGSCYREVFWALFGRKMQAEKQ